MRDISVILTFKYQTMSESNIESIVRAFKSIATIFKIFEGTRGISLKDPIFNNTVVDDVSKIVIKSIIEYDNNELDLDLTLIKLQEKISRETHCYVYDYEFV